MFAAITAAAILSVETAADVTLHDSSRNRDVPIKAYYPDGKGPYPLIVVSPGFGGDKGSYEYLGQAWAGAGYVVVVVTHAGTDHAAYLQYGGTISTDPAKSYAQQLVRTGDVTFVLDSIATIEKDVPALSGAIDASRIGVAGHSMGAGTALLLGGAKAGPPGGALQSGRDARVRAVVAMSPQGPGEEGFGDQSWGDIRIPVMTMSGTLDFGIGGQRPSWRLAPFERMPAGDKYQVTVKGAKHLSFATGQEFHDCIASESLSFWNRYLKGNGAQTIESSGACEVTSK